MNRIVLFTSEIDAEQRLLRIVRGIATEQNTSFDENGGVITIPRPADGNIGGWDLTVIWEPVGNQNDYGQWLAQRKGLLGIGDSAKGPVAFFLHRGTGDPVQTAQQSFVAGLSISDSAAIRRFYSHSPNDVYYNRLVDLLGKHNSENFDSSFNGFWRNLCGEEAYQVAMGIAAAYLPAYLASALQVDHDQPTGNLTTQQIDELHRVCNEVDRTYLQKLTGKIANRNNVQQSFQDLVQELARVLQRAYGN